jgi:hypothetical protein
MNHFLAFRAACAFFLLTATSLMHAQCEADFDFGEVEFGVSPDPALEESFMDGMLGEPYTDVLHILIPATAAGIDDTYPPTLPVDSVIVADDVVNGENDYSGVVFVDIATEEAFFAEEIGLSLTYNNNGDSPNASTFLGANQYCAVIQGVPTRSGQYRIDIDIIAWATIFTPFNVPYTFEDFTLRVNCPSSQEWRCKTQTALTAHKASCQPISWRGSLRLKLLGSIPEGPKLVWATLCLWTTQAPSVSNHHRRLCQLVWRFHRDR